MNANLTCIFALIILNAPGLRAQQSSEVIFASSFYKTASGAIGPQHVTATTTYQIKIKQFEDLKIDSIAVGNQMLIGNGIFIPIQGHTIDITARIAIHQSSSIWYTAVIMANDITYSCDVQTRKDNSDKAYPAIIVYGKQGQLSCELVKDKFDQEYSQYNK